MYKHQMPRRLSVQAAHTYLTLSFLRHFLSSALSWKVHPPTAYCFSKHILFLLPYSAVPMEVRCNILELSRFLVELSVLDYFFVTRRASVVALSSLFNAMDLIDDVDECVSEELYKEMQRVPAFGLLRKDVEECRTRLRILYAEGGYDHCSTSTCQRPRNVIGFVV